MAAKSDLGAHYLEDMIRNMRRLKADSDRAFAQLDDADFYFRFGENTNSIYAITKHIAGNLTSRWTSFLTSDGEKPSRDRDDEFVEERKSKKEILAMWESGWKCLLDTLSKLTPNDLTKTVTIRKEELTVLHAINRAWGHLNHHTGQIMLLARHTKGDKWQWITIPPGESRQFAPRPKK